MVGKIQRKKSIFTCFFWATIFAGFAFAHLKVAIERVFMSWLPNYLVFFTIFRRSNAGYLPYCSKSVGRRMSARRATSDSTARCRISTSVTNRARLCVTVRAICALSSEVSLRNCWMCRIFLANHLLRTFCKENSGGCLIISLFHIIYASKWIRIHTNGIKNW